MKRLHLFTYGARMPGVVIDVQFLERLDRLLGEGLASHNRSDFWASFVDLCNFCDLFCLSDRVLFLDTGLSTGNARSEAYDSEIFRPLFRDGSLTPLTYLTIDEQQKKRVFARWALPSPPFSSLPEGLAWSDVESVLAGWLSEELSGCGFHPSVKTLPLYLSHTPVLTDVRQQDLLVDAYAQLTASIHEEKVLRARFGGASELPIPPVMQMMLARMTTPRSAIPLLLDLRNEFAALREKSRAIRAAAESDMPLAEWKKMHQSFSRDLQAMLPDAHPASRQMEIGRPEIILEKKESEDTTDLLIRGGLDGRKLVAMGLDWVANRLRRRRVQPLPRLRRKVRELARLSPLIERVFSMSIDDDDFTIVRNFKDRFDAAWRSGAPALNASSHQLRQTESRSIETLHFPLLIREFTIAAREASPDYSPTTALCERGFMYVDFSVYDKAEQVFDRVLAQEHGNLTATHGRWVVMEATGRTDEAARLLERLLQRADTPAPALLDISVFLKRRGKVAEAIATARRATEIAPEQSYSWMALGQAALGADNILAADAYRRALQFDNHENVFGILGLAAALGSSDPVGAIRILEDAVGRAPTVIDYWLSLAASYFDSSNFAAAADTIERMRKHSRVTPQALALELSALYLSHQLERAVELGANLIGILSDDPKIWTTYGYALLDSGRISDAVGAFREAMLCENPGVLAAGNLALALLNDGRPNEALLVLQDHPPTEEWGRFLLGRALLITGSENEGLDRIREALAAGFNDYGSIYSEAISFDNVRRFAPAVALYREYLRHVDDHQAWCNLAADLAELGQLEEALPAARRACELKPDDVVDLNTLAAVLQLLGRIEECREILRRIIEIGPDDSWAVQQAISVLESEHFS